MSSARFVMAAVVCLLPIFGQDSAAPSALIERALAVEKDVATTATQYAYIEEKSDQNVDKDGTLGPVETKTFDVIPLEGELYRKLIRVNRQPLPPALQKKVDTEVEKERQQRRKRRTSGILHLERTVSLAGLDELGTLFDNRITGEESIRGRAAWIVESTPKQGIVAKDKKQEQMLCWSHRSWFDKESGVRIQWRDTVLRDVNGFKAGSEILSRRDLGKEGVWLLRETRMDMDVVMYKVVHLRVHTVQTFSNFKKFDVTSTITNGL